VTVWQKAQSVLGYDSNVWRKDACGAWIKYDHYGDCNQSTGWEIDHIKPTSQGGSDDISNLQPLQWENNRAKGDGPLKCAVPKRVA
jgi:5-methylcytosine-specific restriction endonuclease McrA